MGGSPPPIVVVCVNRIGKVYSTSGLLSASGACGGGSTFSYPFHSNATSTNIWFTQGLMATASTTIGDGTVQGGLTINGNATTTGSLSINGGTQYLGKGQLLVKGVDQSTTYNSIIKDS